MTIPYRIFHIETKQFAIFPELFENGANVDVNSSYGFALGLDMSTVKCGSRFNYVQGGKTLLILELHVSFQIAEEGISEIKKKGVIPVDFLRYMATIVVGTARGIIHTKTEGTVLNSVVLPPVNLVETITDDMKIEQ
jgi:hypothetical protein